MEVVIGKLSHGSSSHSYPDDERTDPASTQSNKYKPRTLVNKAYSLLFSERDYIGRKVREVFLDLEGPGIFELLDNMYSTGERFVASAVPVRLQASQDQAPRELRLDFIYEPIRDGQGRITGLFAQTTTLRNARLPGKLYEHHGRSGRLPTQLLKPAKHVFGP